MIRPPPIPTRTTTLFTSTPLFRSTGRSDAGHAVNGHGLRQMVDLVMEDQRQAGDAQHQQEQRRNDAAPFVCQEPDLDRAPRHDRREYSVRSEEHTSELQSLMRISYAGFCLKKTTNRHNQKKK